MTVTIQKKCSFRYSQPLSVVVILFLVLIFGFTQQTKLLSNFKFQQEQKIIEPQAAATTKRQLKCHDNSTTTTTRGEIYEKSIIERNDMTKCALPIILNFTSYQEPIYDYHCSNDNDDDDGKNKNEIILKKKKQKSCALLFFGLAKQFRSIILPSIQQFILNTPNHHQCDIYAHTYNVTVGTSETSATHPEEIGITIDTTEIYDLTPNVVMDTNEEFWAKLDNHYNNNKKKFLFQKRFIPTGKFNWSKDTLTNMYKQWHSIERVWDLMEGTEQKFAFRYRQVGLFRSDVKYTTPIDIFKNNNGGGGGGGGNADADAVIPTFGFVVNDRMFYGLRENSEIWAKIRFPGIQCYVPRYRKIGLHSEFYMNDFILKNIPNGVTKDETICFFRVRGNGRILTNDCEKWRHRTWKEKKVI